MDKIKQQTPSLALPQSFFSNHAVWVAQNPNLYLDGPGRICRYLGVTSQDNKSSVFANATFYITDNGHQLKFIATPRIGINSATDKLWRFVAFLDRLSKNGMAKGVYANTK